MQNQPREKGRMRTLSGCTYQVTVDHNVALTNPLDQVYADGSFHYSVLTTHFCMIMGCISHSHSHPCSVVTVVFQHRMRLHSNTTVSTDGDLAVTMPGGAALSNGHGWKESDLPWDSSTPTPQCRWSICGTRSRPLFGRVPGSRPQLCDCRLQGTSRSTWLDRSVDNLIIWVSTEDR
ncbi:hypothetical protein M430DRAFT_243190 [Amorphotheca resinae ATCC 22711]|jgi:hypothetical protein|uniref:Uncharacterized protein n=1 Tax=Amorphotheca resinae ATCC 22711 TaxID=857342 RepID=A0A2T3B2E5_AMORE|nr:hypothetical protein M430DRAFT_243190 [Amorphotheca resinae ATCC 22711]PSS18731.1 hypothetical protein M430DRAFT_243190 [Amorphotheca resinae ATCC 22711]